MSYTTMPAYSPAVDFSQEEADKIGGRSTVRTAAVDTELATISTLTDAIRANIDLVLRSDGRLKDQLVDFHALHPAIFTSLASNLTLVSSLGTSTQYGSDTGVADSIVCTVTPAPASYFEGLAIWVKINVSCTGGPVVANVNGLGTTPVKQADGTTDPAVGELQAGGIAYLVHDGTSFQHINKTTASASVSAHLADTGNPHSVTFAQTGLSAGDPTDSNATRDKVFSNNDMKLVNDYRLVGHLPLAGGTVSGAVIFNGANTFNADQTFAGNIVMSAKQVREAHQASIASASTVDLATVLGNSVYVTGSVTITGLGTVPAGTKVWLLFSGAPLLTHNATSLQLVGSSSIQVTPGDRALMMSLGSGNWINLKYERAQGVDNYPPLFLYGLGMAHNSVAPATDIDISPGGCVPDNPLTALRNMNLASLLTKKINVNWVAGHNAGGFPSGLTLTTLTWYHLFLIMNSSAGVVDAGFDTSITAANLLADATGYDIYRRIGSVIYIGAAIKSFYQFGDYFTWNVPVQEVSAAPLVTRNLRSIAVPPGIKVRARLVARQEGGNVHYLVYDPTLADTAPSAAAFTVYGVSGSDVHASVSEANVLTDTSSRIAERASAASGTRTLLTLGYQDFRGKEPI